MGRASYIKNDFDGAITTFQFVANEYKDVPKKRKPVPEARRKPKNVTLPVSHRLISAKV
ncbi:hypothetical protein EMGBS15_12190 [Filimonas sp.]|nr:hypothetical protein EMGBS15_12190 [Filimonas sp.]